MFNNLLADMLSASFFRRTENAKQDSNVFRPLSRTHCAPQPKRFEEVLRMKNGWDLVIGTISSIGLVILLILVIKGVV